MHLLILLIRIIYIVELKFSVIGTIIDFPYSHILQQNLQNFFNHIKPRLSHEQLNDWVIEFHINPTNIYWLETQEDSKSFLGVYKRGITYPKIKRKIFSVIIPIPNSNQISWGHQRKSTFIGLKRILIIFFLLNLALRDLRI